MDRFLSHFTHRFDAKGRVSIPAPFRQVLAKDGFEGVYAYPSLDQPALDCGGQKLLAEIDALLATMPPWSPARDAFATALLGTSEILRMDAEGRVSLDERLKTALGLATRRSSWGRGTSSRSGSRRASRRISKRSRQRLRALRAERDGEAPA